MGSALSGKPTDPNQTAKKILYVRLTAVRTVNGHTWARRVSSGARENQGEGTRQNGPVSSEEGVPLAVKGFAPGATGGRSEEAQATVYQKHSTLPSRKAMYRV